MKKQFNLFEFERTPDRYVLVTRDGRSAEYLGRDAGMLHRFRTSDSCIVITDSNGRYLSLLMPSRHDIFMQDTSSYDGVMGVLSKLDKALDSGDAITKDSENHLLIKKTIEGYAI